MKSNRVCQYYKGKWSRRLHYSLPTLTRLCQTVNTRTPQSAAHPELVGPELIDVWAVPGNWLVPEAELEEELVPTRQQHLTPLLAVLHKLLEQKETLVNP